VEPVPVSGEAWQLPHPDPAPYLATVLDILCSCAVRMRPDLKGKFDREIEGFMLEECTVERALELKAAAVH